MVDFLIKFLSGCFISIISVWLFLKNIKDYVNGFRSNFGNDIGLYGASIGGFIIGIALIYKAFSNYF